MFVASIPSLLGWALQAPLQIPSKLAKALLAPSPRRMLYYNNVFHGHAPVTSKLCPGCWEVKGPWFQLTGALQNEANRVRKRNIFFSSEAAQGLGFYCLLLPVP